MKQIRITLMIAGMSTFGVGLVAGQTPGGQPPAPPSAQQGPGMRPGIPRPLPAGFIGVGIQEIAGDRAKVLKLPEEAGVEVTHVDPNSPADKAGLKPGDAVVQYNGQRVEGIAQFSRMVRETPPGREVKLHIYRNGSPQTVTVQTGTRPAFLSMPPMQPMEDPNRPMDAFNRRMPDVPRSMMLWGNPVLGVEAEPIEGQFAQYFGVKEGVLVRAVLKDSAAEKAGIRAGDVITRVDDAKVVTPADISGRIRSLHGKSIPVVLMREHKEMTITVTIDAENHSGELRNPWLAPEWVRTIEPVQPN